MRVDLPDITVMNDGRRVTTSAQWTKRRAKMQRILAYYGVGLTQRDRSRRPPRRSEPAGCLISTSIR